MGKTSGVIFYDVFQGYILPKKFKIDKRILHLSCMIRNNEITREKTLEIIAYHLYQGKILINTRIF